MSQAGFTLGITMLQNIRYSLAPSILAASSSASGICSMNCFIRKSPSENASDGTIMEACVLIQPSQDMTM
ncbi:hypothetical protein D1872_329860 [compost metagenome]